MDILSIKEAAEFLRIGRTTLWRMMCDGSAPPHFRQGRRVFFPKARLLEWMDSKLKH